MVILPGQGDMIILDFNPHEGFEQQGRGRAVIVCNNFFHKLSSRALVCPISNTTSDFPLNVRLDERTQTKASILCQHIKSLDLKNRNTSFVEKAPKDILEETLHIIHSEL